MAQVFKEEEMEKMYILRKGIFNLANKDLDTKILEVTNDLDEVLNKRNEYINALVNMQFQKFDIFQIEGGKEWIETVRVHDLERDEILFFYIQEGLFKELL